MIGIQKIESEIEYMKNKLTVLDKLNKGNSVKTRKGKNMKWKYKLQNQANILAIKKKHNVLEDLRRGATSILIIRYSRMMPKDLRERNREKAITKVPPGLGMLGKPVKK